MQDKLYGLIWVGSDIIWCKPYDEVKASIWVPSIVFISSDHQELDLALKSPTTKTSCGFWLNTLSRSLSNLAEKSLNSSDDWLGDRYKEIKKHFFCQNSFQVIDTRPKKNVHKFL